MFTHIWKHDNHRIKCTEVSLKYTMCLHFCIAHAVFAFDTEYLLNRRVTRVGTFEVCVPTHVALRIFIMQVLASQLLFLANRNAGQAILPLFWPVNCIKIGGHVVLLSDPTVNCLYCAFNLLGRIIVTEIVARF